MPADRIILLVQAVVYLTTGAWGALNRPTFERVTGPKIDYWLVRMVGLLAFVIGLALLLAVREPTIDVAVRVLAIGSAASFAAIDLRYAIPGRISRIYLLDAALEIAFVLALAGIWATSHSA